MSEAAFLLVFIFILFFFLSFPAFLLIYFRTKFSPQVLLDD